MDKKAGEYIEKQKSPQKEICRKARRLILKTLPGAKEEMKWGVPVFSRGKFYVAALKDSVNIGFAIGGLSKEELALFQGSGKTMRHIKVHSLKELDEEKIAKLIKLVNKKARCAEC